MTDSAAHPGPVTDWATDWDFTDEEWTRDPYPIWDDLRGRCPMAHTERFNDGVWLPLRFVDLQEIVHDTGSFSNVHHGISRTTNYGRVQMPPINNDPPEHAPLRRVLLPFFAPKRVEAWRHHITADCEARATAIASAGRGDAAVDYAQHIPVGAIAAILGIDPSLGDQFRAWIHDFIELGATEPEAQTRAGHEIMAFMAEELAARRAEPGDDLISHLAVAELDGKPLDDDTILRMLVLQLVAGIDTTWSSIGAALWHLAVHDDDRRRLVIEPDLIPMAVEELLRAYAPVNVARRVDKPVEVNGVAMSPGDYVLMTFPIACRDPEQFERADEVVIDRARNRHVAFGAGIHRCLGSNLARLEMQVAVETFLRHVPEFSLDPAGTVEWSVGQIRGPRRIPIVVG